jgi:hypothetical protein
MRTFDELLVAITVQGKGRHGPSADSQRRGHAEDGGQGNEHD